MAMVKPNDFTSAESLTILTRKLAVKVPRDNIRWRNVAYNVADSVKEKTRGGRFFVAVAPINESYDNNVCASFSRSGS